jgi:hypothetical protein
MRTIYCVFSSNCCFATKAISVISHLDCFTVPWHACWWQHVDLQDDGFLKHPEKRVLQGTGSRNASIFRHFEPFKLRKRNPNRFNAWSCFHWNKLTHNCWYKQVVSFALYDFFDHVTFWCRSYHQFKHPGYLEWFIAVVVLNCSCDYVMCSSGSLKSLVLNMLITDVFIGHWRVVLSRKVKLAQWFFRANVDFVMFYFYNYLSITWIIPLSHFVLNYSHSSAASEGSSIHPA